jgi:alkyldihydroxyacetonephosphate synthase
VIPAVPGSDLLRRDLAALLSGRASDDDADRAAYARDLWPRQQIATRSGVAAPSPPAVVVWPESTEEVARVVSFAAARGIEVVPFGAGSGVCAAVMPSRGSVVLDMKRMRRILAVDADRLEADVEAGILGQHLEDGLLARGFTLGHYPSSIYCSTLGGWIAARSAGQCSGRYGKIEDMVLDLTCVDGRGRVLSGARRGDEPALLPLVTGSEGILAVVTRARLRICPAPASRRFAAFSFASLPPALDAVRRLFQAGLRPAVARLYDPFDSMIARQGGHREKRSGHRRGPRPSRPGLGTRLLARALRFPGAMNRLLHHLPDEATGGAMLILVWEDDPVIGDAEAGAASELCRGGGGRDLGEGPARRWLEHRHKVSYRQSPMFAAGAFVDTMEVASTWSRLLPMYHAVRAALEPHVFVMAHFSHPYPDGASIYFTMAGHARDDAASASLYDRAWAGALAAVVDAGGTLSHHHGVGRSKAPAMRREQGSAVDVVRALKAELDPEGILNPGSLLPEER